MKEKETLPLLIKSRFLPRSRQDSIISWILQKKYVAELAEQKGSTAHILCDDVRVSDECQGFREVSRYSGKNRLCGSTG